MEDGEMKKKVLALVMLTFMVLVGLSGVAQAGWVTCTVSQVGSTGSNYWVTVTEAVTNPTFTNATFFIDEGSQRGKEMFATALTAFANSTNVQLWIEPPYNSYETIVWALLASK